MLPEFLPGTRNRVITILNRMDENLQRKKAGLPTVGEDTRAAVERLKQKYPNDEWLDDANELVEFDDKLDQEAEKQFRFSQQAHNN